MPCYNIIDMNMFLWLLQAVLAFFAFSCGAYKLKSFDQIAAMPSTQALPREMWTAIGIFEMVCAVLLIVPRALKFMPTLTPMAAAALAIECLLLSGLNGWYSLEMVASNPFVWNFGMFLLAGIVAWGRFSLVP